MSIRNFVLESDYNVAEGIDVTTHPLALKEGFAIKADNINLGLTQGWIKRKGTRAQLKTSWTGHTIQAGIQFNNFRVFAGSSSTDTTIAYEIDNEITAEIVTGLAKDKRVSFVQYLENLYIFNGDSENAPCVFDGTDVWPLGLEPPNTTTYNPTEGTSGSLIPGATYTWYYTYGVRQSGLLIVESSPVEIGLEHTMGAGKRALTFSVIPATSNRATCIRIYRTYANGSIPYLEAEIAPNSTSYTSTKADDLLENVALAFDNSTLATWAAEGFNTPKFPVIARNRLFVVNGDGTKIRYSRLGSESPLLESFPATSFVSLQGTTNFVDPIIGLGVANDVVYVIRQNSIGYLEEVGLPDIAKTEDDVIYIYKEIANNVGGLSHFAIANVYKNLIFLSHSDIYLIDGANLIPIASQLKNMINQVGRLPEQLSKVSAGVDVNNKRVYFSVFQTKNSTTPDLILVGDFQQFPKFRWTTYSGLNTYSFVNFFDYQLNTQDIFFGGVGQYYKMNSGDSDFINFDGSGGEPIVAELVSRPYTCGVLHNSKLYKFIDISAVLESDLYTLDIYGKTDLQESEVLIESFKSAPVSKWEDDEIPPLYGWTDENGQLPTGSEADAPFFWAGNTTSFIRYYPHQKGRTLQLIFKQESSDAPFIIYGWAIGASIFNI